MSDDGRWVETELGPVWKPAKPKPVSKHDAHSAKKAELRQTLSRWKSRTGISAYYFPYFVGKAWLGEGRAKRMTYIGKVGVADCFVAVLGCVIACEVKTGAADLGPLQTAFRDRWTKTGNPHIVYRQPSDLTDVLDRLARERDTR